MKKSVKMLIVSIVSALMLVSALTLTACTCKHEWSDWTTLTAATCETEGVMTRSCSKCGNIENKKVDALGHDYGDWTTLVAATCETDGVLTRRCATCGNTEIKKADALGHVEVVDEAVEATCTAAGKTEGKHCSRCNKVLVQQEETQALGHYFANYIYNNDAICLTDGTKTAKCSRCSVTDTVKAENTAKGHVYGNWTTLIAATCEIGGVMARSCNKCGNVENKVESALGHVEVVDEAVDAICTAAGKTAGKHCSRCGKVLVAQKEIDMIKHEYVDGKCTHCGAWVITEGVEYALTENDNSYGVVGFSSKAAAEVYILPEYNGKPVTTIFREAFANSNIVSVNIPDSVTSIEQSAFSRCTRLVNITIPDSVTTIGESAFYACSRLTSVIIPNGVTVIEQSTFRGCGLSSITIPDSVTNIKRDAFENCDDLECVYITDLTAWCNIDFYFYHEPSNPLRYAKNLYVNGVLSNDLVIPNGITEIKNEVFSYFDGLRSITLPDSITSIGERAFIFCSSLTSITIPNSVTSIGSNAFSSCSSLKEVNYKGTEEQWNKIKIDGGNYYLTNAKRNYIK